ncbi:MAG: hypothetical protein ABI844_01080 [Saprospiraceae bacterium]
MKTIINVLVLLVILVCVYVLYLSIKEPLDFKAEKDARTGAVVTRLKTIKDCQEMHRDIYGSFAKNFEELASHLKVGKFRTIRVIGDPDDPSFKGKITYDTLYESAFDSIRHLGYNLDSLAYVPFANGTKFDMQTDTILQGVTIIDVLECGIQRKAFMGKYADPMYKKFDNRYDPDSKIKFGDLNSPSLAGNWEGKN